MNNKQEELDHISYIGSAIKVGYAMIVLSVLIIIQSIIFKLKIITIILAIINIITLSLNIKSLKITKSRHVNKLLEGEKNNGTCGEEKTEKDTNTA